MMNNLEKQAIGLLGTYIMGLKLQIIQLERIVKDLKEDKFKNGDKARN